MATTTTKKKTQAAKSRTVALKDSAPPPDEHTVSEAAAARGIQIEIEEPEERPGIPVRLVGQDYNVRPPKMAMSLKLGKASRAATKSQDIGKVTDVLNQWVTSAFGKRIGADIMARLEDGDDRLDYDHIMMLIEQVIEHQSEGVAANPPT